MIADRDSSYYDLLASEARLSTFVAIGARTTAAGELFCSGTKAHQRQRQTILPLVERSMFEYLMPLLVMPTYEGTLLDQTCRTAVERQRE